MGFDLVGQDEVGAGIAGAGGGELVAERSQGLGAAGRGERVEPDDQLAVAGDDVAGGGEGFADQRVCLVAGPGVVAVQGAGQDGLGVIGGHPDGVRDLLGLGVEPDHVPGEGAERDPGRDGRRGVPGLLQLLPGGLDRGGQGVDHLVGQVGSLAGGGAAQLEQRGVPGRFGGLGGRFGGPDAGGCGLPGRVGHQPVRVVGGGGVAAGGVEREVGAGVAEVVLLPPP